jgi:hypothetical protein
MRVSTLVIAAAFFSTQLCSLSVADWVAPSDPVVRGSIHSRLSSGYKCLSVPTTETLPGAHLEMRACRNDENQIFEWNVVSFEIKIRKLCVDALPAAGSDSQPGDPVGLWYCQGSQHQKWYPVRKGRGAPAFSIIGGNGPNGDLCLDILNSSNADGTQLVISNCDGDYDQQFHIQLWPAVDSHVTFEPSPF